MKAEHNPAAASGMGRETAVARVGKEANTLKDVEAEIEHDSAFVYTENQQPARDPWRVEVLPVLRQMPKRELAEAAGLSVLQLQDPLAERAQPHPLSEVALRHVTGSIEE